MTWFGGSGMDGVTATTMFKGSLPVGFKDDCGHSVSASSVSDNSSGHDVTNWGVFREAGGRG